MPSDAGRSYSIEPLPCCFCCLHPRASLFSPLTSYLTHSKAKCSHYIIIRPIRRQPTINNARQVQEAQALDQGQDAVLRLGALPRPWSTSTLCIISPSSDIITPVLALTHEPHLQGGQIRARRRGSLQGRRHWCNTQGHTHRQRRRESTRPHRRRT